MNYDFANLPCSQAPEAAERIPGRPREGPDHDFVHQSPADPQSPANFDGAVTERFPDFVDESLTLDTLDQHCAKHCEHRNCAYPRRGRRRAQYLHQCTCTSGTEACPATIRTIPLVLPPQLPFESATVLPLCLPDNHTITLFLVDTLMLTNHLKEQAYSITLRTKTLTHALAPNYPNKIGDMVEIIADMFFSSLNTYITHTLSLTGSRDITIGDLRRELDVYKWTLLRDFVALFAPNAMARSEWEALVGRPRYQPPVLDKIDGTKGVGAVERFWRELREEFIGLVAGRSEEVRKLELEKEKKEKLYKQTCETLVFWVVIFGVARVISCLVNWMEMSMIWEGTSKNVAG